MNDEAKRIRLKVVGIFRKGDRLLALHVVDPTDGRKIYIPPGGGVEFGEDTASALRREMREELNTEIKEPVLVGVLENRFTFAGKTAHEIVFVYEAEFPDRSRYGVESFEITECDGTKFLATWIDFTGADPQAPPIYPEGLIAMLRKKLGHSAVPTPLVSVA
jgi:ADP-ribose pyrophosphatase YjhB (NUDIX family)